MSEAPRRINTERSLNRPTEKRPAEAPASKTSLNGQPDFFQPEEPAAPQELPKAKARPEPDTRQELGLKMPAASSGGTGGNGGGNTVIYIVAGAVIVIAAAVIIVSLVKKKKK